MNELYGLNELSSAQRERILERLRQGWSLRAIEAETGHRRETISRYGRKAGLFAPIRRRAGSERSKQSSDLRLASTQGGRLGARRSLYGKRASV